MAAVPTAAPHSWLHAELRLGRPCRRMDRGIQVTRIQEWLSLADGGRSTRELPPGSIFLDRRTELDWTHTGVAVSFAAETFTTIEGNTNDAGGREGYEVCTRIRGYGSKDFIML